MLWQFQLGGVNLRSFLSTGISLYILTVSNGHSFIERCRGQVLWQFQMGGRGVNWQIYPKSAFLSSLAISCFASQKVFSYYI